ncbi:MAG: alpha/beta hydrolase [Caldimonas sp.]
MASTIPYFREQGAGVSVVCLHSNASSSSQWRSLGERLADRFRVLAIDGYGAGKSPDWPVTSRSPDLEDEVAFVTAVLPVAPERVHVVGHSYGAAAALKLALMQPERVRSVVVYEPTLFSLVAGGDPAASPAAGIWHAATDAAEAVERGDSVAAAERFIDFWMGEGAWAAMPPARQPAVAASMRNMRLWRDLLFGADVSVAALRALEVPVLCLWGDRSPESSLSVMRVLESTLPHATLAPQAGLGHMGPITHPDRVNARIAEFLDAH